jgi:FtsP/CotA-like multicopper oxidase with cupredoxin domain
MKKLQEYIVPLLLCCVAPLAANAQSFRVQCPQGTITHPITGTNCVTTPTNLGCNNTEPAYKGPTQFTTLAVSGTNGGYVLPTSTTVNGAIKCQQISGGDGLMTEADGTQTFMFSFGPLSGLADVAAGLPSTQFPYVFNTPWPGCATLASSTCSTPLVPGDPATTDVASSGASPWAVNPANILNSTLAQPAFTWNGAVGLTPDVAYIVTVTNLVEGPVTGALYPGATVPGCPTTAASANTVTAWTDSPLGLSAGSQVVISNGLGDDGSPTPPGYAGTWTITCVATGSAVAPDDLFNEYAFQYKDTNTGLPADTGVDEAAVAASPAAIDGHVDPREIIDIGVMNGNIPAPLAAFDEDDEFFLTLSNVGMIMRPDLFEQHTVHFHGYPNASSFYDGVPDASVAINIGASFTYYYLAPDAGTYFWHCHITPPEHLQMGMVGQLYVRPRQDRVPLPTSDTVYHGNLYTYLGFQNGIGLPTSNPVADLRTECNPARDILCSATMPAINTGATTLPMGTLCNGTTPTGEGTAPQYVYNDGDASSCYDVTYPIQMHGFDPNFHFVGMTFNPEMFVDMKDKYFLLNGRSYPDTVGLCGAGGSNAGPGCAPGPQATVTTDGQMHYSQPLPAIINIPVGGKASLRLVNLSVAEYFTLQSVGVPMHEVGFNAKLLRDQAGNNTEFWTNSITLGGGESLDVVLDASDDGCKAYLGTGCAATLYKPGQVFYVYSSNLDMLSNDAENFGGMMTEVHICNSVTSSTFGNTCN